VTAPAVGGGGLSIVPPSVPIRAAGIFGRSAWYRLVYGNGNLAYQAMRWGAATAAPTLTSPQTEGVSFVAGVGTVVSRGSYGSVRWLQDALCLGGQLFDAEALGPYSQPQCLVLRELLRFTRNTTADSGVHLSHGIGCLFDTELNSGNVPVNAGTIGFLGYCYSPTSAAYFAVKKARGAAGVFTSLAGFDGSLWHTVDHRLFAPTLSSPAVYELRLNGELRARVLGDDVAFPLISASNVRYHPIGAASSNYAGLTGGIQVARSDIFVCDGSAEALAFL
jgi:hypothetical protein